MYSKNHIDYSLKTKSQIKFFNSHKKLKRENIFKNILLINMTFLFVLVYTITQ